MRSYIRRCVLALRGVSQLGAPTTIVCGTLEPAHATREPAASPVQNLGVGRVSG